MKIKTVNEKMTFIYVTPLSEDNEAPNYNRMIENG